MERKKTTTLALALALGTLAATPAMAQRTYPRDGRGTVLRDRYDGPYNYDWRDGNYRDGTYRDGYYRSDYYRNGQYRYQDGRTWNGNRRVVRRADPNGNRGRLAQRAETIAERAESMFRSGDLTRDHFERTLDKLNRVWSRVENGDRVDQSEFNSDMRWLDQVDETLREWSASDSRRGNNNNNYNWRRR
jgi:hypothetical protein